MCCSLIYLLIAVLNLIYQAGRWLARSTLTHLQLLLNCQEIVALLFFVKSGVVVIAALLLSWILLMHM